MDGEHCIAMTTTGDEATAAALARDVVEARLAACVQIVPIRSVYRWEGSVVDGDEQLLLIKTHADRYAALEAFVGERHPYDVPEFVRVPITGGLPAYLAWLAEATDADSPAA